jgi:hypothetical protein
VIAAVATIVAALIAAVVAVTSGAIEISLRNEVSGSDTDDLEARVADLEGAVGALEDRMEEPAPPGDGDGDRTTPTTQPDVAEVWHETGETLFDLPYSRGIDLDSAATDGDWGMDSGGTDLYVSVGSIERYISTSGTSARLAIVESPPTYEKCSSEQGLVFEDRLTTAEVVSGRMLCYQSSEGRWAYVHVVELDNEARIARLEIVVWKLATDP